MMARLAELGIRRVSWDCEGDPVGGVLVPTNNTAGKNYELTYRQLGFPLKVAVEAGHRHGLEVYGYFQAV